MRSSLLAFAILLAAAAHPGRSCATGNPGGAPPVAASIALPDASHPSEALTPYIVHLDPLLSLQRAGDLPTQEFCALASGRLIALRQQFLTLQRAAPEEQRHLFASAVATAGLLSAALDERQKTVGDITAARQVQGSGKLDEPARKENLTQGIRGGSVAKAVGSLVERDRERQFLADGQARAAGADAAMEAMALNRWNQRAVEWRQRIAAAFSAIR